MEEAYRAWTGEDAVPGCDHSAFLAGWDAALRAAEEKCREIGQQNVDEERTPGSSYGPMCCASALAALREGKA